MSQDINRLRGVISKTEIEGLAARNAARAKEAAQALGRTYCCHPANSPVRVDQRKPPAPPRYLRRAA
jgi:hypothetical protein